MEYYLRNYSIEFFPKECKVMLSIREKGNSLGGSLWAELLTGKPVSNYYPIRDDSLWSLNQDLDGNYVDKVCVRAEWEF